MKAFGSCHTFTVLDYRMGTPEIEWDADGGFWTAMVSMEVRYNGTMSPIGVRNASGEAYYSIDIGRRKISKDGDIYVMEVWLV